MMEIEIEVLSHARDLPLPDYATASAAGMDLRAAVTEPLIVNSRERVAVPTGLKMALPAGYEAQIRPRSGLALKHGISVLNSPGTIDADYRGEIKIIIANLGEQPFTINRGDRIAQMVISSVVQAGWSEVEAVDETTRGADGFGSTGMQ